MGLLNQQATLKAALVSVYRGLSEMRSMGLKRRTSVRKPDNEADSVPIDRLAGYMAINLAEPGNNLLRITLSLCYIAKIH